MNKYGLSLLLLALPVLVVAQAPAGPDALPPGQSFELNAFMQQTEALRACMAKVDQSRLPALQARAEKVREAILAKCATGEQDEAMAIAREYEAEIREEPIVREVEACLAGAPAAIAKMMAPGFYFTDSLGPDFDICAAIN